MSIMDETNVSTTTASRTPPGVIDIRELINGRGMSRMQWVLLVLCMLLVIADGMDVAIMGFLVPAISREWSMSHELFGVVLSAAPVGLAAGALLAGPHADKYGRKRVLLASVLLFGLFSIACALATSVTMLVILRFITGLGLGATMPCTITLLSEYVPERSRSLLITCMFTGFNLGSALIGFIAAAVIPAHGWRAVLAIGGAFPLLLLPLYWRWLPESARFLVVKKAPTADIARTINNVCGTSVQASSSFAVHETEVRDRQPVQTLFTPTFLRRTLTLWAAYFMGLVVIYLFNSWMPTLITNAGLGIRHAANTTALFQVGGTVGAILVGFAMDRLAPQRVIAAAYVGGALAILLLAWFGVSSSLFALIALIAGFFISGAQTGLNAYAPACYPTAARATGVSWMLGIGRFGSIFGSMIGGVMLTVGWSSATILAVLAVPAFLAALAAYQSHAGRTALTN
jgi:AAHS family 4-hydroxybenzoate transporter-like MFS transporter